LGALAVGWAMAGFQMLNGRHFMMHTLVTMTLAWIVVVTLHSLILGRKGQESGLSA